MVDILCQFRSYPSHHVLPPSSRLLTHDEKKESKQWAGMPSRNNGDAEGQYRENVEAVPIRNIESARGAIAQSGLLACNTTSLSIH